MPRYFVIYKPFGMLSQFSGEGSTLKSLSDFPKEVYPVGRLDKDSEGMLLITDDKSLNHYLLDPQYEHARTYLAQVEGEPQEEALEKLAAGVDITVDGKNHHTRPAEVLLKNNPPELPERDPPIRYRKTVPDAWLELSITEGKNRQVRKMTAAVGLPTLRLVRWGMENLTIEGFAVGEVREYSQFDLYKLLEIKKLPRKYSNRPGQSRTSRYNKK